MKCTTDNARTARAKRFDLATALRDPERLLDRATVDVLAKNPSSETSLLEPAVTNNKETDPSFIERMMTAHTVTKAKENMAGTFVESDSDATE